MTETTWDTEETSRIIANDEGLYNAAMRLERTSYNIERLAQRMEDELSGWVESMPYSDVDLQNVDWEEIASEYIEDDIEEDDKPIMCICDDCGSKFMEDDLLKPHYDGSGTSMLPMYVSPCCNADYEYIEED